MRGNLELTLAPRSQMLILHCRWRAATVVVGIIVDNDVKIRQEMPSGFSSGGMLQQRAFIAFSVTKLECRCAYLTCRTTNEEVLMFGVNAAAVIVSAQSTPNLKLSLVPAQWKMVLRRRTNTPPQLVLHSQTERPLVFFIES